jgi:hypothetical protein
LIPALRREVTWLRDSHLLGLTPGEEITVFVDPSNPNSVTVQNINLSGRDSRQQALHLANTLFVAAQMMAANAGAVLHVQPANKIEAVVPQPAPQEGPA